MQAAQLNNEWRVNSVEVPLFSASESIYAFIEPELWPEWNAELSSHIDELDIVNLFNATQFSAIKNGPVVVNLLSSQVLLDVCIKKMSATHCGALFHADIETNRSALMYSLRNALVVKKGRGEVFLRYYDSRGLLPLVASMSNEERRDYFSPINKITWFSKAWLSVSVSAPIAPSFSDYQWSITEQHFASMQSILTQW